MSCKQYYRAWDEVGEPLPFRITFLLMKWDGAEWVLDRTGSVGEYSTLHYLEEGSSYKAVPILAADLSDSWERPDDIEFVACTETVVFVYRRIVIGPRFQYQVIFDLEDPDLGDNRHLLEAEYTKHAGVAAWYVERGVRDCFTRLQAYGGTGDGNWETGWLCQAVEYGPSPCAPLPYWLCPWPSPETIYFRGECSCSHFREVLQPLGIPCYHLIAARKFWGDEPWYCPYVKCP